MRIEHPAYYQGVRVRPRIERIEKDIWDITVRLPFVDRWLDRVQPVEQQLWGSCVAYATACVIEIEYNAFGRGLRPDQQVDAMAIYRRARQMFWPREEWNAGGLYLDQGFWAAIDLEILPDGTEICEVNDGFEELGEVLMAHPLVQGHVVTPEWFSPDPEDGELPMLAEGYKAGEYGLHATALVGTQVQGKYEGLIGQNSWGRRWGMGGYFLMAKEDWAKTLLGDGPYWMVVPDYKSWEIPEQYILPREG